MPIDVYHNILRFKVPVNNVLLMHVLQGQENLCRVKLYPVLLALLPEEQVHLILNQPEEVLARTILENEVDRVLVGEGFLHAAEELRTCPCPLQSVHCIPTLHLAHPCLRSSRGHIREVFEGEIDFLLILKMLDPLGLVYGDLGYAFERA